LIRKTFFILIISISCCSFNVLYVNANENNSLTLYNLFLDGRYSYLIDSLAGDNDNEKLILARSYAAVGDKNNALEQLSALEGYYLPAAVIYYHYGNLERAEEIAEVCCNDSGFVGSAALYLLALVSGDDDTLSIERWRAIASLPVEVFRFRAYLDLAKYYYKTNIADSAMIFLNKIEPVILDKENRIDLYFLKGKLFYTLHDYDNALINLENAFSLTFSNDGKKNISAFAIDSLGPVLSDEQTLKLIGLLKKYRLYNDAIMLLENIDHTDSTKLDLGLCYLAKRKYSKATKIFKDLESSVDKKIRAQAFYRAAICDYRRGMRVNGANRLIDFVEHFPDNYLVPRALFIAGEFFLKSNPEKSIGFLRRLTNEYTDSRYYSRSLFLLGKLYLKLGYNEKAELAFLSYAKTDENADIFDYWLFKTADSYKSQLEKIINRGYPTFYNYKARKKTDVFKSDSLITYNEFIQEFMDRAEKFLSWRVKKRITDEQSFIYADSLCRYGFDAEAACQLRYISVRNSNLHNRLAVLKKSRSLRLDWIYYDVLDKFKIELKKRGFSYNRDTWVRLNYPVLYSNRLSFNHNDIDPYLALSVIRRESRFDPYAVSNVGAMGLMQLMPATASQMARVKAIKKGMLFNPGYNIKLGCKYLKWLERRLKKDEAIIAAYNAGPSAAKKWQKQAGADIESFIETISYDQSRKYARWVMGDYFWYKHLWPKEFDN